MGRRDLDSLRLSQRSNGLAFSHHHFLSSSAASASPTRPAKRTHASVLLQIDGNAPTNPRDRRKPNLAIIEQQGNGEVAARQTIRSLIPPDMGPKRSRTFPDHLAMMRDRRRSSISSISNKSFTSSMRSRRRRYKAPPNLATMPSEILNIIFEGLPQVDLHSLMLTNSNLSEAAATQMYRQPVFASTYRYAQFAHIVSHKKYYSEMVRVLDVSPFGREPRHKRQPLAGWREFKFRHHDLYRAARERQARASPSKFASNSSTHPHPSPFLKEWSLSRDLSIGGLCHSIQACERLIKVNISRLQITADFKLNHPAHPATTWTQAIYLSDVPRHWNCESNGLETIHNVYIVDQLRKLQYLEAFVANNFISLSRSMVADLVTNVPSLKWVDFRNSGMELEQPWSIKALREEIQTVLRKMNGIEDEEVDAESASYRR